MSLISIVVPTRDRADDLAATLRSLESAVRSSRNPVEVIVVDDSAGGTLDLTGRVGMPVEVLRTGGSGASAARNRGLDRSVGSVVVMIDDDIQVTRSWLSAMTAPILSDQTAAVAGAVRIASHLERPWMTGGLRIAFAETDFDRPGAVKAVVSANFAVNRAIADAIRFDEDIGPGKLGLFDDTLFYFQILAAGYEVRYGGPETLVEHHFDERRLSRESLLLHAERGGRSEAFASYHWQHSNHSVPWARELKARAELTAYRLRHRPLPTTHATAEEVWLASRVAYHRQYRREKGRPRKYPPSDGSSVRAGHGPRRTA